jgi:PAS domain S-box-containing protein
MINTIVPGVARDAVVPPKAPVPRVTVLALAVAYFLAARLGLTMAFAAEQVTAVWPATGIALAALVIFGYRLWPGIALGAFLANATTHAPLGTALGIAVGNTLEAVVGAWALHRFTRFDGSLQRLKDVLGLILLAAFLSTTVSATIGVASLCLGGIEPWSGYRSLWWVWWLGDANGDLVMAPVLLTWAARRRGRWRARRIAEAGALVVALVLVTFAVFHGSFGLDMPHSLVYVVFPFIIWAALRFGQGGTTIVTFIASGIAIWGTVGHLGPFARDNVHESLILLQLFMVVAAVTGLLLGAGIAEGRQAERRVAAQYIGASILAESRTLEEAIGPLLESVCRSLDWDLGVFWTVDQAKNELRFVRQWHAPERAATAFEAANRAFHFAPGVGLPGRVWATARPIWLANVVDDTNFPRLVVATREGLRGALGVPIVVVGEVLGVMEFFRREIRPPDDELLETMAALGHQVGQFAERTRSEATCLASEARKTAILEMALDCIITIDHEGRIVEFNPAAEKTFGYRRAEVLGRPMAELIVPERMRQDHYRDMAHYLETGEGPLLDRRIEIAAMRRDGSEFPAELAVTAIRDGNARCFTAYLRDITEQKRGEEALRDNDRRKDEFLAMLAHELRNPLAAISNAIELSRRSDSAEHREWGHDVIVAQVRHLSRMIDDLLDVSRITRGKIQIRKQVLDLHPLIRSAVETAMPLMEERAHRCIVRVAPEPLQVEGDPTRLEQIIVNLLNNAAKYTETSGTITLAASAEGEDVIIHVEDTGIGMSAELLARIFDLFAQGDRSIARSEGGLGIGLTLVKSLVEMHGGEVSATSDGPGRGSRFVVRLPCAKGHPATAPRQDPPTSAAGDNGSRVLVVDDNEPTARGMAKLLKHLGYVVGIARDGPSAIETARDLRPEFVLLDIGLPGMDGYQVARKLREGVAEDAVIIAVSGYGEAQAVIRSHESGFDHHLVKPVDFDALVALLGKPPGTRTTNLAGNNGEDR